jgi:hypothetical protein
LKNKVTGHKNIKNSLRCLLQSHGIAHGYDPCLQEKVIVKFAETTRKGFEAKKEASSEQGDQMSLGEKIAQPYFV